MEYMRHKGLNLADEIPAKVTHRVIMTELMILLILLYVWHSMLLHDWKVGFRLGEAVNPGPVVEEELEEAGSGGDPIRPKINL